MGKKPAPAKMSLAELSTKFGGDPTQGMLPTSSCGKDFAKGKGKGFRDAEDSRAEQNEWRSGGGKGKGRDRDEPQSRSDTGDWFAKERPGGGDRDRDRGGGGGGGGFDRGGPRRDDRRSDDTAASRDSDWRTGDRDGFRGFNNSRGGGGGFDRDRRDDGASQRPKLNLKPRSIPEGEQAKDDAAGKEEDDGFKTIKGASSGNRYVPPSLRKKEEEEARRREAPQDQSGAAGGASGAPGKYVPAHMRKAQEEEDRKAQARQRELEEQQKAAEEAERLEKQRRKEQKEREKAEKERKKEEARASLNAKASKKPVRAAQETHRVDEEKLSSFAAEVQKLVDNASVDVSSKADKAIALLSQAELTTIAPTGRLVAAVLKASRRKAEKDVLAIIRRFAPMFNALIEEADTHRFKVKILCEVQRQASAMGLPRLSPASSLLEVFFDALYLAEVIEEDYYELWAIGDDDTPGKMTAMFQVADFLDFLRTAHYEGESSSEEEGSRAGGSDDEDDDDDDDDIEANVPRRGGLR